MDKNTINVAVIGLGFGQHFARIFLHHPNVGQLTVVDPDRARLDSFVRDNPGVRVLPSFEDVLADKSIDAVHVCTPIPIHGQQSIAALRAGKHCACAVPMAISKDDIYGIVDAVRETGLNYMMMETQLYGTPFLEARRMRDAGELGVIQHMRGIHYQPMENWPGYWDGLPPMFYGTHCIAPLVGMAGCKIKRVFCFGSGTMAESRRKQYGNPYPVEDALFEFESGLKGEVVRGLFECSALSTESFNIYGSKRSIYGEYRSSISEKINVDRRICYDGFTISEKPCHWPNVYANLPREIQRFTICAPWCDVDDWERFLDSAPAGGHEGSHPRLVHEFVSSILEGRKPYVDEQLSANITLAGLCAHESAMRGGALLDVE